MNLPDDGGELTEDGVIALRARLTEAGWRWTPAITRRKFGTSAYELAWRAGTLCDPFITHRDDFGQPMLNTCIVLGPDILGVDFDMTDAADCREAQQVMRAVLGAPACLRHRASGHSVAAIYRLTDGDGLYRAVSGRDGTVSNGAIELFVMPAKLLAFGVHQDKQGARARLQWDGVPGNVAVADLPMITSAQRDEFITEVTDWLGDEVSTITRDPAGLAEDDGGHSRQASDIDELCRAMGCIPNVGIDYSAWNTLGMAMWAASGGDDRALAAWIGFTARGGYDPAGCVEHWQNYTKRPPLRVGAGTIFFHARRNGFQNKPAIQDFLWKQRQARAKLQTIKLSDLR